MVRLAIKPQELVKIHGRPEKQKVGRSSRTQPLNMLGWLGHKKRRMKIFFYGKEANLFLSLILSATYMTKTAKGRADKGLKNVWVFQQYQKMWNFFWIVCSLVVLLVRENPQSRDSFGICSRVFLAEEKTDIARIETLPRLVTAAVAVFIQISHPVTCHHLYLSIFSAENTWGMRAHNYAGQKIQGEQGFL